MCRGVKLHGLAAGNFGFERIATSHHDVAIRVDYLAWNGGTHARVGRLQHPENSLHVARRGSHAQIVTKGDGEVEPILNGVVVGIAPSLLGYSECPLAARGWGRRARPGFLEQGAEKIVEKF